MLTRISSNSRRLQSLVNDILDLSRIEEGRTEILPAPVSPADLARQWQEDMSVLAHNKHLSFRVMVDPELPPMIKQDRYALTKITTNLLSNAIKFTSDGWVSLNLQRDGDHLQIIVADSGIGIPPYAQEYIFDMFRQLDGTTTRQYGGSGLGLSLVQKLTRMLGGSIFLESDVGMGSTFTVTLPLNEVHRLDHAPATLEGGVLS
jgi:signal transduction histidine kinase